MSDTAWFDRAVTQRLRDFHETRLVERLWDRDPTLWTDDPDTPELADRLGWLSVRETLSPQVDQLAAFAREVRQRFSRVVLLGMGGSSLAPEVLWRSFGRHAEFPPFHMLDSTDPRAVRAVEEGGDVRTTLFVVASKSGTTIESMSFYRYFWERTGALGSQFVAITDPGSPLEALALERDFRRVFLNPPDIGGRYSALSLFGLVPAALMGIDVQRLMDQGTAAARLCGPDEPPETNVGARLGAVLGEAALAGRDKLTLVYSDSIRSFGLWVEQLVAESTGKAGRGILPIVEPQLQDPPRYGGDRLFVVTSLGTERPPASAAQIEVLRGTGHPVVEVALRDPHDLAFEFYRWEFATAVAAAVLRVNPFDQPDVAESKARATQLLEGKTVPEPIPQLRHQDIVEFSDAVRPGDYVAVLAYLPPNEDNDARLEELARALRDRLGVAVTVGYGPRYLHSTGQFHKGGPPRGHFIQLLDPTDEDVSVPGAAYSFGALMSAQAAGDRAALTALGRRVLLVLDVEEFLELS